MVRYHDLIMDMAENESDETRKQTMIKVAQNCKNISERPVQTFHEAVQSTWFLFVILQMESNASSFSPGRLDRHLEAYYEKDLKKGTLDKQQALEIIECLWLKFNEIVYMRNSHGAKYFAGFPIGFNIAIGGQDENGNVIETKNPVLLRKTVSTETSELVKTYLQAVMQYGTGKRAQVEGYDIGAKTGTAQKLPRKDGKYLLSYIGYAPQENPEVVIYVVIDEANVGAQDNSSLVLELAKNIMSEAFPYLGITTIEEAGESQTQQSGQSFEDTEYSDYDQDYTDDYSNEDGSYVDENYKPDLDSWATSSNID